MKIHTLIGGIDGAGKSSLVGIPNGCAKEPRKPDTISVYTMLD